jgi:uncharacterized protein (DUF2141 family)
LWSRALLACVLGLGASLASAQGQVTVIHVAVRGLRSDAGQVGCVLFGAADGFPSRPEKALRRLFVPIAQRAALCEFRDLPPGRYAFAAIHDENGDGALAKTRLGIPREGVACSRDARPGLMHGPRFDDAALTFAAGDFRVTMAMRY